MGCTDLIFAIAVGIYRANQKFCFPSVWRSSSKRVVLFIVLTTNQFVAVVIDVARPRMLMLKISGGYTHATQAHVIANTAT